MDARRRWYPPDMFPSLWDKIDALIESNDLISSEEVLREIERKDDDLHTWAKAREGIFLPLGDDVQATVGDILEVFPTMVDSRTGKSFADPFVVATAMTTKTIVVTGEMPTGSQTRPKIPDVCEHFDVPWTGTVELIRMEGWRF